MASLVFVHKLRDTTESETWEVLELVIGLEHITHLLNRLAILVLVIQRMERCRIIDLAIRSREINGHRERDLPA